MRTPGSYGDYLRNTAPQCPPPPLGILSISTVDMLAGPDFFLNVSEGVIDGFIVEFYGALFVITTKQGFDYVAGKNKPPHIVGILRDALRLHNSEPLPPVKFRVLGVEP